MLTNEEAIAHIKSHGFHAFEKHRGDILENAILIPFGEPETFNTRDKGELTTHPGSLWICPKVDGSGKWYIDDHNYVHREYNDLVNAVDGALAFLRFIGPYVRKRK